MTRKDFFFLSHVMLWSLSAIVLVCGTLFFKWVIGDLWMITPIALSGLLIFLFFMSTNKKFNHWIFEESKTWNWLIRKHSFIGLVRYAVANYNNYIK